MKKHILLIFIGLFLGNSSYAQKKKDRFVFSATTLNYYPELAAYSFFKTYELNQDNLILNFLTAKSGTFTVEDVASQNVNKENINKFPTPIFSLGASLQVRKPNSIFHEYSISRLSSSKSSYTDHFSFRDSSENNQLLIVGYEQSSFVLSLRYEFGKLFGKTKSKVRFGLSGMLEPNLYTYKRTVSATQDFPIKAKIVSLSIALNPILSWQLSKKVFLDIKAIPRFLIADFGQIEVNDPTLPLEGRKGQREYNLPRIDIAGTLQLRYLLKEPKKRRKRSSR